MTFSDWLEKHCAEIDALVFMGNARTLGSPLKALWDMGLLKGSPDVPDGPQEDS